LLLSFGFIQQEWYPLAIRFGLQTIEQYIIYDLTNDKYKILLAETGWNSDKAAPAFCKLLELILFPRQVIRLNANCKVLVYIPGHNICTSYYILYSVLTFAFNYLSLLIFFWSLMNHFDYLRITTGNCYYMTCW